MIAVNRLAESREAIRQMFLAPEPEALAALQTRLGEYGAAEIGAFAASLITAIRDNHSRQPPLDAFLHEYGLDSDEGIVLMGLAEALLRIPDSDTQQRFLREKLADADWLSHWLHSDSSLVNLATGALFLGGRLEDRLRRPRRDIFTELLGRLGEPVIGATIKQAMQQLARRFVIAEDIEAALRQAAKHQDYLYSFDMLGEAALTGDDAERYYRDYMHAIGALAAAATSGRIFANPSLSIKLSALCPRYEPLQYRRIAPELLEKLTALARQAREANISVTIDAEEAERLPMSLDIFATLTEMPALKSWSGLGLAVQAYQKCAISVIHWLRELAKDRRITLPVRLVKGAYWDSEIKLAQEQGWRDYPVFTRKSATDISYLACARLMLAHPEQFYPQFATHNAYSVAAISRFGQGHPGYEFQRLHGMGTGLYAVLPARQSGETPCRIYAPVGGYRELLPYLVRRLLENGANTSFINRLENPAVDPRDLCRDPREELLTGGEPPMPPPPALFGKERENSLGLNLTDADEIRQLQSDLEQLAERTWQALPLVSGIAGGGEIQEVSGPCGQDRFLGSVAFSNDRDIERALAEATQAFYDWRLSSVESRAACLVKAAELLELHRLELVSLCLREGGRTLRDALAEVREAVDYCRFYAAGAVELFGRPIALPGPVGEENRLFHTGRGVFACISPWNFPVAIFIGQIAAALVAGNAVIAKPARQTCLTAMRCIRLLHQAGIPENILHFLPGEGQVIGRRLLSDHRITGVAFTGSSAAARLINQQLASRQTAIAAVIAETGGINVMIADNTAHVEQLVRDALQSAFNSAGQRCSCLRVLFLPHETADAVIARLIGAMRQLRVGAPADLTTDVGPVIDRQSMAALSAHVEKLRGEAKLLYQAPLENAPENGCYFPPALAEIPALSYLQEEVFGPVLHVVRYESGELRGVINAVNASGYGLTLGVHSRIKATQREVQEHALVGNIYVNRNTIGAVVGVQPFGGMGLSGTGPKAGGPEYLYRFAVEQTLCVNTAAMGGNPWLLAGEK